MELTDDERRILSAIVDGRHESQPLIPFRLAHGREAVRALIAAGFLVVWETRAPSVTLTPIAAEAMGVVLDERIVCVGPTWVEQPHWRPNRDEETGLVWPPGLWPLAAPIRLPARKGEYPLPFPDRIADPASEARPADDEKPRAPARPAHDQAERWKTRRERRAAARAKGAA